MLNNGPTATFIAEGTVTAGQVVAIDATGVSMSVRGAVAETGERPIGVALTSATTGEYVTVALPGSICYAVNADDTTAIDAGDHLETNNNAVLGTVNTAVVAATGGATVTVHDAVIGYALDDIAGEGYGRMLVWPHTVTQPNSS